LFIVFFLFFNETELSIWFFDKEYRRLVPKVTTEVCSLYKIIRNKPMLQTLVNAWQKFGRVPTKCPIKKVNNFIIAKLIFVDYFYFIFNLFRDLIIYWIIHLYHQFFQLFCHLISFAWIFKRRNQVWHFTIQQ
jgi:hypothetical protein